MSEDESGEGSASSADEEPVDQDEDSQADLNASMQEMNVQQVKLLYFFIRRGARAYFNNILANG